MNESLDQFKANLQRVRTLSHTIQAIDRLTTNAVDLSDLLRSQIVLAVSAPDHFIHEYVKTGMLKIHEGQRLPTEAYLRFQIPLKITQPPIIISESTWLDNVIREKHAWRSFQHPDRIADAVRLISPKQLWPEVEEKLNIPSKDIKDRLNFIVDRRNKIAHEADMIPTKPGDPGGRWPIDSTLVKEAIDFIEAVGEAIYEATI